MAVDLLNIKPYRVNASLTDKIFLMYGEMGTRKTSVACSFPNHLLFAYDIGYKFIDNVAAVPMQTWVDFKSAVKQLDNKEVRSRYQTVVVDTIGMAYTACYNYMLTQMGISEPGEAGFGMGWKRIRIEFETVLRSIVQKGYGLIMLAHSDEVEKEDPVTKAKKLTVKIDIDKRPDLIIKSLADIVLYLSKEPKDEDQSVPTVYAYSNLVSVPTKSRCRYLSPRFEFTFENLQKELEKGVAMMKGEETLSEADRLPSDTNPYAAEQVEFKPLQDKVISLGSLLVEKGYEPQIVEILTNIFKGQKLSELPETEDNITKLQVALSTFEDLKEKARL